MTNSEDHVRTGQMEIYSEIVCFSMYTAVYNDYTYCPKIPHS